MVDVGTLVDGIVCGQSGFCQIWQLRARHAPLLFSPERWRLISRLRQHRDPIDVSENSARQLPKIRRLLALSGVARDRCLFLDHFPAGCDEHWVDQPLRFGPPPAFDVESLVSSEDRWHEPRLHIRPCDRDDREAWRRQCGFNDHPLILLQPGNKRAI